MNPKHLLALPLVGLMLTVATPAFAGHDSSGVNLADDDEVTTLTSSRTGHAPFKAAELKNAKAKLAKDQLKKFSAVYDKLAKYPGVRDQLAALLVKNRLKQKDADGNSVLDDLYTLASKPAANGISGTDALADLVSDICRPSTIAQAGHNTCTATSIQSALARSKPGEYARVVSTLATKGSVSVGGIKLKANDYIAFKDRSVSSNLMQPAIMQAEAEVEGGTYKNKADKTYPKKGKPYAGAMQSDVAEVESHLLGGKFVVIEAGAKHKDAAKIRAVLHKATAKNPMLAGVSMSGGGGHEIQVVGYDKKSDQYKVRNPWGQVHLIPAAKFEAGCDDVNYRK